MGFSIAMFDYQREVRFVSVISGAILPCSDLKVIQIDPILGASLVPIWKKGGGHTRYLLTRLQNVWLIVSPCFANELPPWVIYTSIPVFDLDIVE